MLDKGDTDAGHRRSISISVLIALAVIALLMLPRSSGAGLQTIADWHDQSVFLKAVVQSDTGLPEPGLQALVGPAYIALTRAIARITSLGAAEALIILSRLTLLVCAAILMTVALRDRSRTGVAFQILLAAVALLSLTTSVWYFFSDIPWTHFVAAALLGGMVLASLSGVSLAFRSAVVGALAITLVQTRLFEAMVAGIATLVIAPVAIARYWSRRGEWLALVRGVFLPCIAGAVAGFVMIGWVSHNWSLYQQYSSQEAMVVTFQMLPTKAIQLFWDTCYATLCSVAEPLGERGLAGTGEPGEVEERLARGVTEPSLDGADRLVLLGGKDHRAPASGRAAPTRSMNSVNFSSPQITEEVTPSAAAIRTSSAAAALLRAFSIRVSRHCDIAANSATRAAVIPRAWRRAAILVPMVLLIRSVVLIVQIRVGRGRARAWEPAPRGVSRAGCGRSRRARR